MGSKTISLSHLLVAEGLNLCYCKGMSEATAQYYFRIFNNAFYQRENLPLISYRVFSHTSSSYGNLVLEYVYLARSLHVPAFQKYLNLI